MITAWGLGMLCASSILQAFQAILEEQIFRLDPELNPLVMGGIEAFWKICLGGVLVPLYRFIPCPDSICEGGRLENLKRSVELLTIDRKLCVFVLVSAFLSACAQLLGMMVIKHESAVHKTTITLALVASVWVFFMAWPYEGKEPFNWVKLVAILIIFVGSFWFVYADHKQHGIEMIDGRAFYTSTTEKGKKDGSETLFGFSLKSPEE